MGGVSMEWYYALIIAVLAVGLIGVLIFARMKSSKNVIKHVRKQSVQNLKDPMEKSIQK